MTAPDRETARDLQQEIEQTRERLGQTVEELAARADVKAQDRAKAAEVARRIRQSQAVRPAWPLGVAAGGVLMMVAAVIWKRWET